MGEVCVEEVWMEEVWVEEVSERLSMQRRGAALVYHNTHRHTTKPPSPALPRPPVAAARRPPCVAHCASPTALRRARQAFTLEYVDLQLNMLRKNLTQLYVPTARAEFRLWEFGWQDVPYFVRRRSEEQARKTKQHLETKWGVQFPNTGFCNFVKFSVRQP